jgi:hypothetical protein
VEGTCWESDLVLNFYFGISSKDGSLPPRVGLYLVIFRRYAWYFTEVTVESAIIVYVSSNQHSRALCSDITLQYMGVEHTLRTEELPGDVQGLAAHDDDLLAVEQLLGHSTGQPAKEVTLAIDRDLFHLAISTPFLYFLVMSSREVRSVSRGRRRLRGGAERRLTTLSKVDILSYYTVNEKTDIAAGCRNPRPA